mmetsp:Transcript_38089/g.93603  ORF Transcript_38089/g.93603 Transcript_38089/m.93603 type:complete len:237 (-) Transcript_38089:1119-1829(-)
MRKSCRTTWVFWGGRTLQRSRLSCAGSLGGSRSIRVTTRTRQTGRQTACTRKQSPTSSRSSLSTPRACTPLPRTPLHQPQSQPQPQHPMPTTGRCPFRVPWRRRAGTCEGCKRGACAFSRASPTPCRRLVKGVGGLPCLRALPWTAFPSEAAGVASRLPTASALSARRRRTLCSRTGSTRARIASSSTSMPPTSTRQRLPREQSPFFPSSSSYTAAATSRERGAAMTSRLLQSGAL